MVDATREPGLERKPTSSQIYDIAQDHGSKGRIDAYTELLAYISDGI